LVTPRSGTSWESGTTAFIEWEAGDEDEDSLFFIVQYSGDGGASWNTLATNVTEHSLEVEPGHIAGSWGALVRVLASDGVNTALALSPPFTVDDKPPLVWILSPRDGRPHEVYQTGDIVALAANGTDREEGALPADAYIWQSDRDGVVGYGRQVETAALSPGVHRIIVWGQDSFGNYGSDESAVVIIQPPNSQPDADAGPDRRTEPGEALLLNGTGSADTDGDPLEYYWTVVEHPNRSNHWLSDPESPEPLFSAEDPGGYLLELVVHDGQIASQPDRMTVNVAVETCQGDLNGDGARDGDDVDEFAGFYGLIGCVERCAADLNGDFDVDGTDLARLLRFLGLPCR
jgi:hypothetical protein